MSVDIKISTNERKLSLKLKKKQAKITPGLLIGMRRALEHLRGQEDKDLARGSYGLKTKSGALRRSLAIAIRKRGDTIEGFMGTNLPYAAAHEFGIKGGLKPKGKGWLTIPFKGVTGRAREYTNTFFARSKKKNLILFQKTGPTTIRPLFVLKKMVKVKKRKWMSKSYRGTKKDILMIMRKSLRKAIA